GEPWQEELEQALKRSRTCAVFVGPSGIGPWHHEEMRSALQIRVGQPGFRVIPVLLPRATKPTPNDLPLFLSRLPWVDFRRGLDDSGTFHQLVAGIRGLAPGRDVNTDTRQREQLQKQDVRFFFEYKQDAMLFSKPDRGLDWRPIPFETLQVQILLIRKGSEVGVRHSQTFMVDVDNVLRS